MGKSGYGAPSMSLVFVGLFLFASCGTGLAYWFCQVEASHVSVSARVSNPHLRAQAGCCCADDRYYDKRKQAREAARLQARREAAEDEEREAKIEAAAAERSLQALQVRLPVFVLA